MRVAVCLSGQPRNARESFNFIYHNIIEPNNADVFFHTYFDPENPYMEKIHMDRGECVLDATIVDDLVRLYKPKKFLVEKPKSFYNPNIKATEYRIKRSQELNTHKNWTREEHERHVIKQMMSMFYSIFKANELKETYACENGFAYDYCIRVRFDLIPQLPIFCELINPNALTFQSMGHPDNIVSDWINIGSNMIMNIFSSTFFHLEYLNSYQYYSKSERLPSTLEDDEYGGFYEYAIRDMMSRHNIPTAQAEFRCILHKNA